MAPGRQRAEKDEARHPGHRARQQDSDLGRGGQRLIGEGQAGDEQRHREPDSCRGRQPEHVTPRDRPGQAAHAEADGDPRSAEHAHGLAEDEPEHDPDGDPGIQNGGIQAHPRVDQREQRHDAEGHPEVEPSLDPFQRGSRVGRVAGQILDGHLVRPLDAVDQLAARVAEVARIVERTGGGEQPEHHAGDGRFHPGPVQRIPARRAEDDVGDERADLAPPHDDRGQHGEQRDTEPGRSDAVGVEHAR